MTSPHGRPATGLRWGLLSVVVVGGVVLAVVAGLLGLIFGGDFASGGRAPVRSALFWAASGAAAALPVALLPWLGSRVRRPVAISAAGVLALTLAVVGWLFSAS